MGLRRLQRREDGEVESGVAARAPEEFVGDEIGLADAERQRQHHALAHAPQRLFHDFSDVIKHLRHGATLACSSKGSTQMSLKKPALDPMSLAPRTGSGYPEPYRSRVLPREKRAARRSTGAHEDRHQPHHAAAGQGILDAPLAHARGRIHLRVVRRSRGEDRCRRAGARRPACARDFRLLPMARPATAIS